MAMTKVQIISNSVTLLGGAPILSLDSQGDMVNAAEQAFDFLLNAKLSEGFWRFATTYTQLSQVNITIPQQMYWLYAYQLPGDFKKLVRLHPQNYAFEIYGDLLYSNVLSPQYIEYTRPVEITDLPDYFTHYFIYELALYLCLSTANSAQYYTVLKPERDYLYGLAQANDAQNRPQSELISAPMIWNRWVSSWANG